MKFCTSFWRSGFMVLIAAAPSLCAAQNYSIADLGTLPGGSFSEAHAINASAVVTGLANASGELSDMFAYRNGILTDLGTLGGTSGTGNGVNASGQIAGYSTNASGTYRAFLTVDGTLTDIGDLGGGSAVGYALNDAGQVVGSAVTADGSNHPFLYSAGKMTDLGTLGSPEGNSWWNSAQGINNNGEVVGTSYNAQGNFRGFVWLKGKMSQMGTLGGSWSQAYAVNNKGQVSGIAYTKGNAQAHAFLLTGNQMKDLGTLDNGFYSWGFAINDSGVVVGQASPLSGGYVAFVYSGGKMKDLNQLIPAGSGWVLQDAYGVNAAGQIVGEGLLRGQERGFLLTLK
jgi:probable HAF family extracellular repeat protein